MLCRSQARAAETTANVLSATIALLALYPEEQEWVYGSIIHAIGDRAPVRFVYNIVQSCLPFAEIYTSRPLTTTMSWMASLRASTRVFGFSVSPVPLQARLYKKS